MQHAESIPGESPTLRVRMRKELVLALGDSLEPVMKAADVHMMDAMSTILMIHKRGNCLTCYRQKILGPFINWVNEKGYTHFQGREEDYDEFMRQLVLWTLAWTKKETAMPCTDGSPSHRLN